MRAVLITAGAVVLAAVILRRLRAREQARQPLPRRTRAVPGLPDDGPLLSWADERDWDEIVGGYGDDPAWPGGEKAAP